jgi:hypothetical protein
MIIDSAGFTRLLPVPECIVEERVWLRGAEVVSHVNYTQLERVRSSRGIVIDPLGMPGGFLFPLVVVDGRQDDLEDLLCTLDGGPFSRRRGRLVDGAERMDMDAVHQPA